MWMLPALAAASLAGADMAHAGTEQLPSSVVATNNGSGEPTGNAIDGNTSTFYGLGVNGSLLVDFMPPATGPVSSVEVTFGGGPSFGFEGAEVWAYTGASSAQALSDFNAAFSFTGGIVNPDASGAGGEMVGDWDTMAADWVFLGVVDNTSGAQNSTVMLPTGAIFSHLAMFDISGQVNSNQPDGYDVAKIAAVVVPTPTAVGMGLAGVLGLAGVRRRRV
jgi:MYXO-CTERM domain-containing protein